MEEKLIKAFLHEFKIHKNCLSSYCFLRLFGVAPAQFHEILIKITPLWQRHILGKYKRPCRNFALSLEDMLLMVLLYYRTHSTQIFIGFLFGLDDSRVCRLIQKLEPLLVKIMVLPKQKQLSQEEPILVDATEQSIERLKKGQKPYYSGKKKRHTLKTEIRTTLQGRIIHVSKSHSGSVHDFNVHKQEPPLHPKSRTFVDSGYQGLDKHHSDTEMPYKASKKNPLDKEAKDYNQPLSRLRVRVEDILGDREVFRILGDRYRNKRKRYTIKFKIIAAIVNLKNGFKAA